jgi:hypothetical protein
MKNNIQQGKITTIAQNQVNSNYFFKSDKSTVCTITKILDLYTKVAVFMIEKKI